MKISSATLCRFIAKILVVGQLIFGPAVYGLPAFGHLASGSEMKVSQMETLQQHSVDCDGYCSEHVDMGLMACDGCIGSGITADSVPPAVVYSPVIDSLSVVFPVVVYLELNLPPPK